MFILDGPGLYKQAGKQPNENKLRVGTYCEWTTGMFVILSQGHVNRLYARISGLTLGYRSVGMTVFHFAVSWELMVLVGGESIASGEIFWYFYATTATTVGYGDYSPVTEAGTGR